MSNYDNTNSGVLFKNKKKETEKHPDYTGKINVNGEDFRLAAWIKESKGGNKFMSLAVSEQREESKPKETRDEGGGGFDDDIPFIFSGISLLGVLSCSDEIQNLFQMSARIIS